MRIDESDVRFESLEELYSSLENIRIKRQKFVRENVNRFMD